MNNAQAVTITLLSCFLLNACTNTSDKKFEPNKSYLGNKRAATNVENKVDDIIKRAQLQTSEAKIEYVDAFNVEQRRAEVTDDVVNKFSEEKTYKITADTLKLADFLHQVLGEQLGVSYILSDDVKNSDQSVTLNIQQAITERKLFLLVDELLTERGYTIRFNDNIFYVHKSDEDGQTNLTYG